MAEASVRGDFPAFLRPLLAALLALPMAACSDSGRGPDPRQRPYAGVAAGARPSAGSQPSPGAQPSAVAVAQPPSSTVPGTADPDSAAEPQPVASLPPGAYNPGAGGFTTADPLSTHPAYGNSGFGLRRYR